MAEDLLNKQENRAFLSQFLTEGVYVIQEEKVMAKDEPGDKVETEGKVGNEERGEAEEKVETEAKTKVEEEPQAEQKVAEESDNSESIDEANAAEDQDNAVEAENEDEKADDTVSGSSSEAIEQTGAAEGTQESAPAYQKEESDSSASDDVTAAEEPQAKTDDTAYTYEAPQEESQLPSHDGANQKGILILVAHQSEQNLLPKEKLILTRILKAVNLSLDDVAVVNLEKTGQSLEQLTDSLSSRQILAFGIDSTEFPIPVQPMNPEEWNGLNLLPAPSLESIAMSKQYKKQLWQNLKTLFNV